MLVVKCNPVPSQRICTKTHLCIVILLMSAAFFAWQTYFLSYYYARPLSAAEEESLTQTFLALLEAVTPPKSNLTFFLHAGSLLGSYRHHDMIPWDDDIDIMFSAAQKSQVRDVLSMLTHDYGLYTREFSVNELKLKVHWKLYSRNGRKVNVNFTSPFVDIFFFVENETHVWNEASYLADECYLKRHVFPLTERPFRGRMVPAPCDPAAVLSVNYDLKACKSPWYSHLRDESVYSRSVMTPCRVLEERFPFVRRNVSKRVGYEKETLVVNGVAGRELELRAHC